MAGRRSSPDSRQALEALCAAYWYPLYAYVRRRVVDVNEAQDLTQAFFAELLAKNYVGAANVERGRFRAFLLTALKNFLSKEWQKAKAQKRGGSKTRISLDFEPRQFPISASSLRQDSRPSKFTIGNGRSLSWGGPCSD